MQPVLQETPHCCPDIHDVASVVISGGEAMEVSE